MAVKTPSFLWFWIHFYLVLMTVVHRNSTYDLSQGKMDHQSPEQSILIFKENKGLKEEIFSILKFLLLKLKDCFLYQETCIKKDQDEKCNPDLVVVAMAFCSSDSEICDAFFSCSGETENNCPFGKEQTRECQHINKCPQCFYCCNSSSKKECFPRSDIKMNWTMLEEKKNTLLTKHDKKISECHGFESTIYWMIPQVIKNELEITEIESFNAHSALSENKIALLNLTILAADNRIAIWKYDTLQGETNVYENIRLHTNIRMSISQIKATVESKTAYGLARLFVLDECNKLHVICQLVMPVSFKPRLRSRHRKLFYEKNKESLFCVKDHFFTELIDGGPPKCKFVDI
ncbi:uncharacterized protein LOC143245574 [Tachypleus tridentatus]|uniref:uncharacterized protein LOC143245574 n=1 Tax=Tachypleus tridentatus TaxID=6853 RepID=UPI003FCF0DF5